MSMYNFKFSYLSRGQLVSLNLDKIVLPLLKILPCYEAFFGNLIFAIIARMLCGNHLKRYLQRNFARSFYSLEFLLRDLTSCVSQCNLFECSPVLFTFISLQLFGISFVF